MTDAPGIGHNSEAESVAGKKLASFIEHIERLNEDKAAIGDDIKQVFEEAKGNGFDTKIMRKVIALRKLDPTDRQEQDALLDMYRQALGI